MSAEKEKDFLLSLTKLTLSQLRKISSKFSRSQIKAIREVVLNLVSGNIPVDEKDKRTLSHYKKFLRELARRNIKRSKFSRYCRALLVLLKAAAPILNQL